MVRQWQHAEMKRIFCCIFLNFNSTDEWNKQSICKLYNNETTHHQNTNCDNTTLRVKKQTKEKKQHFRRKEAKQGGGRGLFLFLSCAVLVCLTRSSRKEIKSEITQLSNNIFCSYLVSDREISQGRKGKEEHREGCVVCIQNRFTTIIFWYFAFGKFIYKSKGFFQWENLRFTCCCIFLAWTTVCAQDTKLFSPTRYTSKKKPKKKKPNDQGEPVIKTNALPKSAALVLTSPYYKSIQVVFSPRKLHQICYLYSLKIAN